MLLFPDNFITVCFYYMIINIHQGHDAFVPSDDAGVYLTKKVNMFPFNRSPYSRKQQSINCEPVTKGPFTPESRSTPALSRSGKMVRSAMSGHWSGRAYVGLKYSGDWSDPLWEVVVSGISFSTGWKMVGDDPALHRSYVERGDSVVVGGTA